MNIGKLKHRVTIERYTALIDDYGFEVKSWVSLATVSAQVQGVSGREFVSNSALLGKTTWRVFIRPTDIGISDRIMFGDEELDVIAVLQDNDKTIMTIICES